jgi:hypothetical protein
MSTLDDLPTHHTTLETIKTHMMKVEVSKTNAEKEIMYALNDIVV